jgi:lipopolysaccharide/colanic/teichoic acid biosynthesis glycosyltransferase
MSDISQHRQLTAEQNPRFPTIGFLRYKRLMDILLSLLLMPALVCFVVALIILNPFLNIGPVIFRQARMGKDCRMFVAFKFRTMTQASGAARGPFEAVETARITPLGRFLRATRIDELPQIINVLRGEMSMIGPRPDAWDHARVYLCEVPAYAARYQVRPGITGYAQTEVGYVDSAQGLQRKLAADAYYITHLGPGLDLWIIWRTLVVVLRREGR